MSYPTNEPPRAAGRRPLTRQEAARQIDGEQGARQIDPGIQNDIAVDGGPGQGPLPVPDQGQQQGGVPHQGQPHHHKGGAEDA